MKYVTVQWGCTHNPVRLTGLHDLYAAAREQKTHKPGDQQNRRVFLLSLLPLDALDKFISCNFDTSHSTD